MNGVGVSLSKFGEGADSGEFENGFGRGEEELENCRFTNEISKGQPTESEEDIPAIGR